MKKILIPFLTVALGLTVVTSCIDITRYQRE